MTTSNGWEKVKHKAGKHKEKKSNDYKNKEQMPAPAGFQNLDGIVKKSSKKKKKKSTFLQLQTPNDIIGQINKILKSSPGGWLLVSGVGVKLSEKTGQSWNKKFKSEYGSLKDFLIKNKEHFVVDEHNRVFIIDDWNMNNKQKIIVSKVNLKPNLNEPSQSINSNKRKQTDKKVQKKQIGNMTKFLLFMLTVFVGFILVHLTIKGQLVPKLLATSEAYGYISEESKIRGDIFITDLRKLYDNKLNEFHSEMNLKFRIFQDFVLSIEWKEHFNRFQELASHYWNYIKTVTGSFVDISAEKTKDWGSATKSITLYYFEEGRKHTTSFYEDFQIFSSAAYLEAQKHLISFYGNFKQYSELAFEEGKKHSSSLIVKCQEYSSFIYREGTEKINDIYIKTEPIILRMVDQIKELIMDIFAYLKLKIYFYLEKPLVRKWLILLQESLERF